MIDELSTFKHKIYEIVRFHEVDLLGVCNNAVYFNYFEDARIKYLQDLKTNYHLTEILEGDSFFIMARNECDYIESAGLDEQLIVYTKIDFIKNSSFGFQHIIVNSENNRVIAKGGGVVVHFNKAEKCSMPLPDEFFVAVKNYEKEIKIMK